MGPVDTGVFNVTSGGRCPCFNVHSAPGSRGIDIVRAKGSGDVCTVRSVRRTCKDVQGRDCLEFAFLNPGQFTRQTVRRAVLLFTSSPEVWTSDSVSQSGLHVYLFYTASVPTQHRATDPPKVGACLPLHMRYEVPICSTSLPVSSLEWTHSNDLPGDP